MEIAEVNGGSTACSKKSLCGIIGSYKCEGVWQLALNFFLSLYKDLLQWKHSHVPYQKK